MEIWLTCQDCPDYEVSNYGNVRSKDRVVLRSDTLTPVRYVSQLIVKSLDRRGYERVRIRVNKVNKSFRVHRLVATAFIPNPENKQQVNHKDGVKTNNHVENLEWATNTENQNHAVKTGLREYEFGEDAHAFTGRVKVLDMQGNFLYHVSGNREMKEKGFDFRLVSAVCLGKRNSHKGHKFEKEKKHAEIRKNSKSTSH